MVDAILYLVKTRLSSVAPYISMGRLYTKMVVVNLRRTCTMRTFDVIENALLNISWLRNITYPKYATYMHNDPLPFQKASDWVTRELVINRKMFQYAYMGVLGMGALDRITRAAHAKFLATPTFDRKTHPFGC